MSSDAISRILAAARSMLAGPERRNVGIGVALKDAIVAAGVSRATGYRAFDEPGLDPQTVFTRRLIESMVEDGVHINVAEVLVAAQSVIEDHQDVFDHGSPDELAVVLREALRQATNAHIDALAINPNMAAYIVALATNLQSDAIDTDRDEGADDGGIVAALRSAETRPSEFVKIYEQFATLFGLRIRPPWTWQEFYAVASASAYGTALRAHHNPTVASISRPTGPNGTHQRWTALGITIESLIPAMTEPNPRINNPANTAAWST